MLQGERVMICLKKLLPNSNIFIKKWWSNLCNDCSFLSFFFFYVFFKVLKALGFQLLCLLMVGRDCRFKKCFCCYCSILIFHFVLTKSKPAQLDTSWFWFVLILRECLKWHKQWGKYFKPCWWLQHWSSRGKHQKIAWKKDRKHLNQ